MGLINALAKLYNGLMANDGTGDDLRSGAGTINGNSDIIVAAVNALAASQGSGVKPFATKAALVSAQATLPAGTVAVVFADATPANNTSYVWDGATLTTAFDRLTFALGNGSGFQQAGAGALLLSIQAALRNRVPDIKQFNAKGDMVTDDTASIQAAFAASKSVVLPPGDFIVTGPITIPSAGKLIGSGVGATRIFCRGASAGFVLSAPVGITNAIQGCDISDMSIVGQSGALTALKMQSVFRSRIERVVFSGFFGAQVSLTQLWDSWFEDCYFIANDSSNRTAAITISNGTGGDNSNNLRFVNCTWETLQAGAMYSKNETGTSSNNYNFFFSGCKSEGCNLAQTAPAQFYFGGVNAHPGIAFKKHFAAWLETETTNTTFVTGVGVGQLSIEDFYATLKNPYVAPLVSMSNGRGIYMKNISIQDTASGTPAFTSYFFKDLGGTINFFAENLMYNNSTLANGANSTMNSSAQYSPRYIRTFGIEGLRIEKQNTGSDGYYQVNLNVDGTITENTTLNGTATPSAATRVQTKQLLSAGNVNGVAIVSTNGSIRAEGGAWNSGKLLLGSYRVWVDSTGRLRIKSGDPTGDTDGTVVGAQS